MRPSMVKNHMLKMCLSDKVIPVDDSPFHHQR